MRQFNTEGLSREALQEIYEITVTHKLVNEHKIDRLRKELAVAITAIEDGKIKDLDQVKKGLTNLFLYCESYTQLEDELGENEERWKNVIKLDEDIVKDMTLEKINAKVLELKKTMKTPPSQL